MPKPVIFVPGLPASHLIDSRDDTRFFFKLFNSDDPRMEGPDDLTAAEPIRAGDPIEKGSTLLFFDLAKQADRLYELLERIDVHPVRFGWDWRRPVWDDAHDHSVHNRLEAAIEAHGSEQQKAVIIAHSTGGLALRTLLESKPQLAKRIERIIAFGVPWAGALKSPQAITGKAKFPFTKPSRAQEIMVRSWAAWDLQPPNPQHCFDANGNPLNLTFREVGGFPEQRSALLDTAWVESLPQHLRADARLRLERAEAHLGERQPTFDLDGEGLEVINIVGFGTETPYEAELLVDAGGTEKMVVTEEKRDVTLDDGDGTAPFRSAMWLRGNGDGMNVKAFQMPVGLVAGRKPSVSPHSRLWSNPGGSDLLRHYLVEEPLDAAFCHAALDDEDINEADPETLRLRAVAQDLDGSSLDDVVIQSRPKGRPWTDLPIVRAREGRFFVRVPGHHVRDSGATGQIHHLRTRIGWRENGSRKWKKQNFGFLR